MQEKNKQVQQSLASYAITISQSRVPVLKTIANSEYGAHSKNHTTRLSWTACVLFQSLAGRLARHNGAVPK